MNRVRVSKHALNYFRSLARKTDLEIQAFLVGTVVSPELTIIKEFHYTKEYADQTTGMVRWWANDFEVVQRNAEEKGFRIVGDLHSHPSWDSVLSPADHRTLIESGFRICGVCSVLGNRTRVRFWVAESSLPLQIEYAEAG